MKRVNLSILLCCAIGSLVAYAAYSIMLPSAKPAARPHVATSAVAAPAPLPARDEPEPLAADLPSPPPSWLSAAPMAGTAEKQASPVSAAETERKRQVAAAMENLQQLQTVENPDLAAVAAAFGKLEKAHGSPVFHGIRLDALRNNIEISQKMQPLVEEMNAAVKAMGNSGAAPSPEQLAVLKTKREQLQALSRQMRTDISAPRASSEH